AGRAPRPADRIRPETRRVSWRRIGSSSRSGDRRRRDSVTDVAGPQPAASLPPQARYHRVSMSDLMDGVTLPLFPLPDVVHFPQTDLKLQIYEPHYRRWVHEPLQREAEEPLLLGLRPARAPAAAGRHRR